MRNETAETKSQSPRRKDLPFLMRSFRGSPESCQINREYPVTPECYDVDRASFRRTP